MNSDDPCVTDPGLYRVVMENDRVRVLEYRDTPGALTNSHHHPDSVMITFSDFRRRVTAGGDAVDLALAAGQVRWVGAQDHVGENIGDTDTHAFFIEVKDAPAGRASGVLGPTAS